MGAEVTLHYVMLYYCTVMDEQLGYVRRECRPVDTSLSQIKQEQLTRDVCEQEFYPSHSFKPGSSVQRGIDMYRMAKVTSRL
jgi:hypothetical protein